jgi:glycine/D-amino acid oxidase-like deaminating enzyme
VTHYKGYVVRGKVIVVGAGIIGSASARSLAVRGLEVTVIDRSAAVGGTSASGEGNLLVSDKAPGDELRLAQYAAGLWPNLLAELDAELGAGFPSLEYELKGGLVVALTSEDSLVLDRFAELQRQAGVRAVRLSSEEARALEPELSPTIASAVFYPDDAQVQPAIAAEAFLASARLHGARVILGTTILGPLFDGDGTLTGVMTTRGELRAQYTVVCAGPWSGEVATLLGGQIPVVPRKGMVLVTTRMPRRILHKVYDADYVGAVGSDSDKLHTSSVIEATASGPVLIGSSRQSVDFDRRPDIAVIREIAAKAIRLIPFLANMSLMRTYCGFRPFVPDHVPLIGEDRSRRGLWYATGHEGAGIGLAPATGEILAALVAGEAPTIPAAPFSPRRTTLDAFCTETVAT